MQSRFFIETRRCDWLGCRYNYEGKCDREYTKEEIEDIIDKVNFECYNIEEIKGVCLNCGSKLRNYKTNYDDTGRYFEIVEYCAICGSR